MVGGALAVMAVALLPFMFIPTVLAYLGKKRRASWFATANVLFLCATLYNLYAIDSNGVRLPVPGALTWWLVMFGLSLRKDRPRPEALDEIVELKPYDSSWPAIFEEERKRLAETLSLPTDAFEHIGSTAVPGLIAKPVVDIMLGAASLEYAESVDSRLGILGYENFGEAGVPGRVYLRLRGERNVNLHVVKRGGEHWVSNLALRELLRRDPAARERYAQGKQAALDKGDKRLLAYSEAKNAVLAELLTSARAR